MKPAIVKDKALHNLYKRQLEGIKNTIAQLHEDLQFDYTRELESLEQEEI